MPSGVYIRTKPVWNKGLTRSDLRVDKCIKKRMLNPIWRMKVGTWNKGLTRSIETKQKISQTLKEGYKNGSIVSSDKPIDFSERMKKSYSEHPEYTKCKGESISKTWSIKSNKEKEIYSEKVRCRTLEIYKIYPEIKNKISNSISESWKRGDYDKRTLDLGHARFQHNGHYHRSNMELKVCNDLTELYGKMIVPNFKVGRYEVDFVLVDEYNIPCLAIEFHPWDWELTIEEYTQLRTCQLINAGLTCPLEVWTGNYAEKLKKKVVRIKI